MAQVAYQYFWNLQTDEQGRSISMMDGFKTGDPLRLAHGGTLEYDDFLSILDRLFHRYNIDRPGDYLGPSMSVGSVVTLFVDGVSHAYAVESIGFSPVDISLSEIRPCNPLWQR